MYISLLLRDDIKIDFQVAFNTVTIAQKPYSLQAKRVRKNVDMNWLFHKGDIAMKHAVKAGGQGGLADTNVIILSRSICPFTS